MEYLKYPCTLKVHVYRLQELNNIKDTQIRLSMCIHAVQFHCGPGTFFMTLRYRWVKFYIVGYWGIVG